MKVLYAPWRSKYFNLKQDGCVFCAIAKQDKADDDKNGVIWRGKHCFGVMNLYPYSPGHFMIIPYTHEDAIENLSEECWQEMSSAVRRGVVILKQVLKAQGVNIGMNLGKAAGAGIAQHVHYHLVPRWSGDTNFITTIGKTRVAGSDLEQIYPQLKEAFNA